MVLSRIAVVSASFFVQPGGEVWALTRACEIQDIAREMTQRICRENGIPVKEMGFTLTEAYGAEEAFCTGNFSSHIHVVSVDSRKIRQRSEEGPGSVTRKIAELYKKYLQRDVGRTRAETLREVELVKAQL